MSPALAVYRLITRLLEPLAPRLLDARAKQGKEDPARVDERLGHASVARPDGELVWLHGVSVGETLSLLPVVERLRRSRPDLAVLVTSGTLTSAHLLARRLPAGVIHQFAPVDTPGAVTVFLDHWRPTLAVFVESELWPNLILAARRRGVKLVLASARITEKTVDGWRRFPGAAREILSAFVRILPQDETSAARLHSLGARIDGHVNLKLSGEAPPHDAAAFTRLSAAIGDRPVVVAASTHDGEEIALVRALDKLADRLCLILVPRHPDRGAGIAAALSRDGYRFALRSQGSEPDRDTDLYLADTLGEMGLFLRLADVVVMGGSFSAALEKSPVGGHNPLEPARLGKPAVTGPDMTNWAAVTEALVAAGGLAVVEAPWDLPAVIAPLLANDAAAKAMGERGRRAAAEAGSGLDRLWETVAPLLPAKGGRR
ncbi:MAG: 3-deoxy-D-manno-octulosonic acid transferase [Brevundimonas sp.]|uniref:3-deoxy-D-manno-octulosonic acid transferase n=1 Tax=Brevundimonas sp. TaxID=1871086 RepID=UPI00271C0177|nr:3-deoxy-D-manno-octulosonic acid transferase [Brevundimonas sp.]MDO9078351.1 3-deoxy-D-manno-octulosonic acid transferase [Brevundimonas sp.]MDP3081043.1 3-deoxy-D-manno-octulosonic acid transferase [Brevundimonas sp.]MDZ4062002.1 3-deoxy-D-manno-octulosonic acid transferase [Brevundimonas sp.]